MSCAIFKLHCLFRILNCEDIIIAYFKVSFFFFLFDSQTRPPSQGKRDETTSVDAAKAKADAMVHFFTFGSFVYKHLLFKLR